MAIKIGLLQAELVAGYVKITASVKAITNMTNEYDSAV